MPFPDPAASQPAVPPQDAQTLIALLGNLMPLLLRFQSQSTAPVAPFTSAGMLPENPMLDQQAAASLIEDIIADSLRTLSGYLDIYAGQYPGLGHCVAIVTQAAHRYAARDYAQAFGLIWQAYRAITALRASNPQLPAPRAVALAAGTRPTTTQIH